jgi:hypothetical protein
MNTCYTNKATWPTCAATQRMLESCSAAAPAPKSKEIHDIRTQSGVFTTDNSRWMVTLDNLRQYITSNDKLPSRKSTDPTVKQLGQWVTVHKRSYKDYMDQTRRTVHKSNYYKHYMDQTRRTSWEALVNRYSHLFLTNQQQWIIKLNDLKQYLAANYQLPSQHSKDPTVRQLGLWIKTQKKSYKKEIFIMRDQAIRTHWEAFMNHYPQFLLTK